MSRAGLTVRALNAQDDLGPEYDLRHRAFGPITGEVSQAILDDLAECVAESRLLGAWDDGILVGTARYYDMAQWWHGRSQPMAGVGGVKVAPEARARGVGKALMSGLLAAMSERGYPLSALYPATPHLYRSLGWELAGSQYLAEMPCRTLTSLRDPDPRVAAAAGGLGGSAGAAASVRLRRAEPADAEEVIATLGAVHAASLDCGPCTEDVPGVRRWLAEPGVFAYLAQDGFLAYGWYGGSRQIQVHVLQAASARTARALWGIVGSHASIADTVRACVGPADPITWLTSELDLSLRRYHGWMLRVLDAQAAIAARGFPAGTQISVPLALTDKELPANTGRYTLTVRAGRGSLDRRTPEPGAPSQPALWPAGPGQAAAAPAAPLAAPASPVTLGPRGFAALFAGVPMAALRVAGLLAGGDPDTDAALDSAFAGQPYLLYYF